MSSSHPNPLTRRGLLSAASVLGLAALTACSNNDNSDLANQANSADGKGYVSGDGSVTEFKEADRGDPVDFEGKLFGGTTLKGSDLTDKPSLLNFWYAGCAPCRAEAPHLQKLFDQFGDKANFYGINLRDEQGTAEAFERNFGVKYQSVEDRSGGVLMALSQYVPAQAVPTTLILDSRGRVAARVLGQIDESVVRTLLQDQVDGKDSSSSKNS
ncbi:TlpA disulfide reductase family protein [Kocuria sp. TGY1127_2]|uniref:TlpA family protein disulfide reductase n=1 Tax=Kocuria sp. TGY1127_2 TaxID=2711328 RepID=UPI0015C14C4E|nr:TlpA disulfide reductase family protein [Kocuria sp. TGY1127_2]